MKNVLINKIGGGAGTAVEFPSGSRGVYYDKSNPKNRRAVYELGYSYVDKQPTAIWSYAPSGVNNGSAYDRARIHDICMDSTGSVFIATEFIAIKKLDSTGKLIWSVNIDYHYDIFGLCVDASGYIYCGRAGSGSSGHDVMKLSSSGGTIWKYTGHTNYIFAVCCDSSGNVYSCSDDKTVRKINSSGNQVWSFTGHTVGSRAVSVDTSGNVYSGGGDYTVRKINSSGNEIWKFTGHTHFVYGVTVDENGNTYSCSYDKTVRKINPSGTQVWNFTGHTASVNSVAVDSDGNLYSASGDYSVRKINPSGNQVWSFTGHRDEADGVCVDEQKNVYATYNGANNSNTGVVIKIENGTVKRNYAYYS